MHVIKPDWQHAPANVRALSTLRSGGVSLPPYDDGRGGGGLNLGLHVGDDPDAVMKNRARLRELLPADPVWLNQVHGNRVVNAAQVAGVPDADASIATEPGIVCAIQTADCLPVLFSDARGRVVAAAHAGWRGLAAGVLDNTVSSMLEAGAQDILAWLGPAIGPTCFEVGEDVKEAFLSQDPETASSFYAIADKQGKYLADIYQLAQRRLNVLDVKQVCGKGFCTVSDSGRFFSYRRDKTTGRMASLIWIEAE